VESGHSPYSGTVLSVSGFFETASLLDRDQSDGRWSEAVEVSSTDSAEKCSSRSSSLQNMVPASPSSTSSRSESSEDLSSEKRFHVNQNSAVLRYHLTHSLVLRTIPLGQTPVSSWKKIKQGLVFGLQGSQYPYTGGLQARWLIHCSQTSIVHFGGSIWPVSSECDARHSRCGAATWRVMIKFSPIIKRSTRRHSRVLRT